MARNQIVSAVAALPPKGKPVQIRRSLTSTVSVDKGAETIGLWAEKVRRRRKREPGNPLQGIRYNVALRWRGAAFFK